MHLPGWRLQEIHCTQGTQTQPASPFSCFRPRRDDWLRCPRVCGGQIGHGKLFLGISKQVFGPSQGGVQKTSVTHPSEPPKQGNLLSMKCQGLNCANPDRFFHLFRQFLECISITANNAIGNLHLGAELFVVRADLEARWMSHSDKPYRPSANIQPRQSLLGQNDAGGVADRDDFCGRGHGSLLV